MTEKEIKIYDTLVDYGIATEEELNLVKAIHGGSWEDILDSVCYVRTGYQTFEQLLQELN